MFGIFDTRTVNRHDKTIEFMAISGERQVISLRSSAMAHKVRQCLRDQLKRKITAVELKPLKDGRMTLASAGVYLFQGTLVRQGEEHVLHCARVESSGVKVPHKAVLPVDFESGVRTMIQKPMLAAVEGHMVNGRLKGFRSVISPLPAPEPQHLPAAE